MNVINNEINYQPSEVDHLSNNEVADLQVFTDACKNSRNYSPLPKISNMPVSTNDIEDEADVHSRSKRNVTDKNAKFEYTEDDTLCAIGNFRPQWLQKFATPRVYLVLYSIIGVIQGSYFTYFIGVLSTLEKRYAFKSKIGGAIMTVDELTPLFLGVFVGYFGGKTHRPRIIACGMFLTVICCFISALPYFLYGSQQSETYSIQNSTAPELCTVEKHEEQCDSDDSPPTLSAVLLLGLGSFLKGFGNLTYYAVGLAYLDDNAKKENTPVYFGINFSMRLLGPTTGFLMSSFFLKFYENPFIDPGFGPDDPRWIGGWWMGFVLQAILLFIFACPFLLLPKRLPGTSLHVLTQNYKQHESPAKLFRGLLLALKRLAKNPVYVLIVVSTIINVYGSFGHYMMMPKYMENQFHLSASQSSLYSGPPGLVAIMFATVTGGMLIWLYRPSTKLLLIGMVLQEILASTGFFILMIPKCETVNIANFGVTHEGLNLESQCNLNCTCSLAEFSPVCGPDGKTTYFSPCFAGCTETLKNSSQVFENCVCIDSVSEELKRASATSGLCIVENCWSQSLFYTISIAVLYGTTNILKVAHTMVLFRSIEPRDKSVALGTFEAMLCLFAFIPYPVVFGSLVDSACLIWEKTCNEIGNCWFYDMDQFNYLLHGTSAFLTCFGALLFTGIYFLRSQIRDLYADDEIES